MKVKHGVKEKILWVGDSINCNLDFNYIARQTDMDVKPAKAYAASADAPGSKFPKNNFLDVVEKELEGDDFKVLVLGGGNVEITNLNTIENTDDNIASFKDGILTATQMLFSIAETALQTYPELQKVILLRRPPRFDPVGVDPLQLKPQLSKLGDAFLFDLWCNSRFKNRIFLGDYLMPDPRDHHAHLQVYGHPDHVQYDGLHMSGPGGRRIFQECILNTLDKAGLISPKQKSTSPEASPSQPSYDPLKMFKDQLIYQKQKQNTNRTAAGHPRPSVIGSGLHDAPAGHPRPPVICSRRNDAAADYHRPSVIGSCSLQVGYFVPVSNQFDILGN